MKVFKNRVVAKLAQKNGISDSDLWEAVKRAEQGRVDADLGGGVIKQRVARSGVANRAAFGQFYYSERINEQFSCSHLLRTQRLTSLLAN